MTDAHSLTSLPVDEGRQIMETVFQIAIHMEYIAAMLRRNQGDHRTAGRATTRKACADEFMATADMTHTESPPEKKENEYRHPRDTRDIAKRGNEHRTLSPESATKDEYEEKIHPGMKGSSYTREQRFKTHNSIKYEYWQPRDMRGRRAVHPRRHFSIRKGSRLQDRSDRRADRPRKKRGPPGDWAQSRE